jgi:hypothetical protein
MQNTPFDKIKLSIPCIQPSNTANCQSLFAAYIITHKSEIAPDLRRKYLMFAKYLRCLQSLKPHTREKRLFPLPAV